MIEVGTNKLKKSYGANEIFENVSFELHSNEIIGLIGRNGTGKSTLMKILMGDENAEGDVFLRKGIKLSYLNQIPIYDETESTIDVLYKAFISVQQIKKHMTILEKEMAILQGDDLEKILNRYSQSQHEFEVLGGYEIEEKVAKIVTGLQLENIIDLPFNYLSGGEKTRVMLGKVLLENPDVLLLDEPTNHLDIEMVSWLEEYLRKYNGAAIIISHDRYFLDLTVTKIIELHRDGIEVYQGNYSYYKIEKQRRYEESMKEFLGQQKKIKSMEEQIKRYRVWGNMRDSDKMYRKAKELEKRLAKIDKLDKPGKDHNIKLDFKQQKRSGKRVYRLSNVSKTYDNILLFKNLNLEVIYQDCLTIIGGNGTGKSTIFKLITQEIKPDDGTIHVGASLKVGYLPQEIVFDDESLTLLDTYQRYFECTIAEARSALARILFTKEDVFKTVKILSGGEKSRLKLLLLMDSKVNVLLLDEPTNHLDIESREILEDSLLSFQGTVIVISHDRYFINKFSNKIAELSNQELKIYIGDYNDYLLEKQKEKNSEVEPKRQVKESTKRKSKESNATFDIKKKIDNIQLELEKKEAEVSDLNKQMDLNGKDLEYLQELYQNKNNLEKEIDALYEELENIMG